MTPRESDPHAWSATGRSSAQRYQTALHEAGHAIVSAHHERPILSISAQPAVDGASWGRCDLGPGPSLRSVDKLREQLTILAAGHAAECLVLGDGEGTSFLANTDGEMAMDVARSLHGFIAAAEVLEREVLVAVDQARAILEPRLNELRQLAEAIDNAQRVFEMAGIVRLHKLLSHRRELAGGLAHVD